MSKKRKGFYVPHPSFVLPMKDKELIKEQRGMKGKSVIGTCGFLHPNRRLVEICQRLTRQLGKDYAVNLFCSRHWRWRFPEIEAQLRQMEGVFLDDRPCSHSELNEKIQMCDLAWCWTDSREEYASGVASDLTACVATVVQDKPQHEHVFGLKNSLVVQNDIEIFLGALVCQAKRKNICHLDDSISWSKVADRLFFYLKRQCIKL
jgi:hypothetical protein